jgi:hypothetical protein
MRNASSKSLSFMICYCIRILDILTVRPEVYSIFYEMFLFYEGLLNVWSYTWKLFLIVNFAPNKIPLSFLTVYTLHMHMWTLLIQHYGCKKKLY